VKPCSCPDANVPAWPASPEPAGASPRGVGAFVHFSVPPGSLGWLLVVLFAAWIGQQAGAQLTSDALGASSAGSSSCRSVPGSRSRALSAAFMRIG
jgi:hypothetical protein